MILLVILHFVERTVDKVDWYHVARDLSMYHVARDLSGRDRYLLSLCAFVLEKT